MINNKTIFLIIILVIIYPIYKISNAGRIHEPYTIWTQIKDIIILNKTKKKNYTESMLMKTESDIIDKLITNAKIDTTYDYALKDSTININTYKYYTTYNNFYELGTGKSDPSQNGHLLQKIIDDEQWTLTITSKNKITTIIKLEDLLKHEIIKNNIVKRKYRHRCVEAWSINNLEYIGFECNLLIKYLEDTYPNNKLDSNYIGFETFYKPESLPGQNKRIFNGPYKEGLRMDEAMHPLTMLVIGFSNKRLLPQNGAPIRLVVPWKYGIKSIKSISKINFVDKQPETSWNQYAPQEFGFYANVNPKVNHPRWSQETERTIGNKPFTKRQETKLFNGYEKDVAKLYEDMDLNKHF